MLRTVLIYSSSDGREMPLIESSDSKLCEYMAKVALAEYADSASQCEDAVLAEIIRTEAEQVRRVLSVLGLPLEEAKRGHR